MTLQQKDEIRDLNYRYALYIDTGMTDPWVELFVEDGLLDEREFDFGSHEGHEAIRAYGRSLKEVIVNQVHLMCNHLIEVLDDQRATGTVFALVEGQMRGSPHMRFHVRYEDEYANDGTGWKFKSRVLRKSFDPEVVASLDRAGAEL